MDNDHIWVKRYGALGFVVWLIFMVINHSAFAHDYWKTGEKVDPQTKSKCCGASDTKEISPNMVVEIKGVGFWLKDTNEVIPYSRVQPSQDNAIWVSRWDAAPNETKCFFYPYAY